MAASRPALTEPHAPRDGLRVLAFSVLPVLLGSPARAYARAGSRLLIALYVAPLLVPTVGIFAAMMGLRLTRSPVLWRFLCALLAINSCVLGSLFEEARQEPLVYAFVLGQLAMAGAMLFTFARDETEPSWRVVLSRLPSVSAFSLFPGIVVALVARW